MTLETDARQMLSAWRGDSYSFGLSCLADSGPMAARLGASALVVANSSSWNAPVVDAVLDSLARSGVRVVARCEGSKPNSPLEDVYRIQDAIESARPSCLVVVGAGSTIDAVKAASVLAALSAGVRDVEPFFGVGKVSERPSGRPLAPIVAVETASSSGSHLTRYANVTDVAAGQKKLIVDMAIVPRAAVFDYSVTASSSRDLTCDGAFDGLSHCLEVYFGAKGDALEKVEPVALAGIGLIARHVTTAAAAPADLAARVGLGLGTDLGGYAIMLGSTNGGHLTSFSLVDVTTHGRATAILNPFYTVLFASAIQRQLRAVAAVYASEGLLSADAAALSGRALALEVARAMTALPRALGFPVSLGELPGFTAGHIDRAVAAAKNPQLRMKLQAMPVPMDAALVDRYMRPTLQAAASGDLESVPSM